MHSGWSGSLMGDTMLEFRKLTKEFNAKRAVSEVTLDIPPGQMVGIIGRSGAGQIHLVAHDQSAQ